MSGLTQLIVKDANNNNQNLNVFQDTSGNLYSLTSLIAQSSGGLSLTRIISASASNQDANTIKSSAGQIFGWTFINLTGSQGSGTYAQTRFVKIYNVASPTSSSTPVITIAIPPNETISVREIFGIPFNTAIGIRITCGYADNDANAANPGDVIAHLLYQ